MSQATDIYLIESLWPDLKVVRQLGSGLFGSVYEVSTEGLVHTDRPQDLSGHSGDLSLEDAVELRQTQPASSERYAIRVLTLPRNVAAGQDIARDLGISNPQDLAAYYKDLVQGIQEEIHQLQDLQFDSPFLKILDYKALKQLQGPGWHVLIRTEFLPSLSAYKPLEETLFALQNTDSDLSADLDQSAANLEAFQASEALALSRDISQALSALHAHNLTYGPILPSRIFRQGPYSYKLGGLPISGLIGTIAIRTGPETWPVPLKVYLSPELAQGGPPSQASDIFALGLLLLQLVSPQDFEAYLRRKISPDEADHASPEADLAMPHLQAVLPDFAQALTKATATDPKDRYPSLEEFQKDLQAVGESLEDYIDQQEAEASSDSLVPDIEVSKQENTEEEAEDDTQFVEREDRNPAMEAAVPSQALDQPNDREIELEDLAEDLEDASTSQASQAELSPDSVWTAETYPEDADVVYRPIEPAPLDEAIDQKPRRTSIPPDPPTPDKPSAYAVDSAKDARPSQHRWLLPLLVILCLVALAAVLYVGYIFLRADSAGKAPITTPTQQEKTSTSNSGQDQTQLASSTESSDPSLKETAPRASSKTSEPSTSSVPQIGEVGGQTDQPDQPEQVQTEETLESLHELTEKLTRSLRQLQASRKQLGTQLAKSWQAFLASQGGEVPSVEESQGEEEETQGEEKIRTTSESETSREEVTQTSATVEAAKPTGSTYVVQNGDILYTILYRHYGAYEAVVDRVLAVNPQIENINNLPTGLEIFLPDLD
ncbi:MAG: tail protein X [Eubacteriales bacterium]|nr:tail protein X [Clostridiales bacterium]MDY5836300.1 tail protein X [Eubacteriales bacterium]